jgi:GAF domain-containing protein
MKEENRVKMVMLFQKLDLEKDNELNDTIVLASKLLNTPISSINLIGENEQWIKARIGFDIKETPRKLSFCTHTIKSGRCMIVNDTFKDDRFSSHPDVLGNPGLRFYAGAPLITKQGYRIGTLCIMDYKPRVIRPSDKILLKILAKHVVSLMESKLDLAQLKESVDRQNWILSKIAETHSHEYRRPVTSILGLLSLIEHDNYVATEEYIIMLKNAAKELDHKTQTIMTLINDLRLQ